MCSLLCYTMYINIIHTDMHMCVAVRSSAKNFGQGASIVACSASLDLWCKSQQRMNVNTDVNADLGNQRLWAGSIRTSTGLVTIRDRVQTKTTPLLLVERP